MDDRFLRNTMYLGTNSVDLLSHCHIAVVGIGGVGSWAAEAIVRSGIGEITLVDYDTVDITNINRQIIALSSTIGQSKVDVMASRALDINPLVKIHPLSMHYNHETRDKFFNTNYSYIIDAIDLVSCKLDLIETAVKKEIPIISVLGTGNKRDPSQFAVTDISKTSGCPFARIIRKELRSRGILHHKVVYSPEPAISPLQLSTPSPGRRSVPSSLPWVPSVAGLIAAGTVINDITKATD